MAYKINYIEDKKYIELIYSEFVIAIELKEVLFAAFDLGQEKKCLRYLADLSEMKGGGSISDLMQIVGQIQDLPTDGFKEALIPPKIDTDNEGVKFYETACINRGLNVKVFREREEAIEWLIK